MKEGNILNNPTALPYSSTSGGLGLKVSEIVNPTSKYVYQIQLHNGVNVLWDGDKSVEIELPLALNDVIYGKSV